MYGLFGNKQFLKLYFCTYTTIQKFGVSYIYIYLKKLILLFSIDESNWSNVTVLKKMFSSI